MNQNMETSEKMEKLFGDLLERAEEFWGQSGGTMSKPARKESFDFAEELKSSDENVELDIEIQGLFDKIFKNMEDLKEKARAHNVRLPGEVQATKLKKEELDTTLQLLEWDEIELFKKTEKAGPLKRFMEEFEDKPYEKVKRFRKRGGRKRRLVKEKRGLEKLDRDLCNDSYVGAMIERNRVELAREKAEKYKLKKNI